MSGPEPAPVNLAQRAAKGMLVTLSGQGLKIAIQLVSLAVLARLLSPSDYGLVAMTAVIIGIADIFRDFGLSTAAIQATALSRKQRDNLFWINAAIGLLIATVIYSGAGLIGVVYNEQAVVPLAQTLAGTFIISGIATQYRADLNRKLRFGALAIADVVSPLLAFAVALLLALQGAGVWALVAQQLVQGISMLVIVAIVARWLPGLPTRKTDMNGMLSFGWNIMASQLIAYASNNIDSLVIGVRYGPGPLGLYSRAFQLVANPLNQVRAPATGIAIPILSKLKNQPERFSAFLLRGQLALGHSITFALAIVAGASAPLTDIFLGGDEWSALAPLLTWIAIAGVFQTLAFAGYWVYVTRNLTGQLVRYTFVSALFRITLIIIGSNWGVLGVAVAYALAPALTWPVSFWWLSRLTTIPLKQLYLGAARILCVGSLTCGVSYISTAQTADLTPWLSLLIAIVASSSGAVALFAVLPPLRRDASAILDTARRMLLKNRRGGSPAPLDPAP